MKLHFEPDLDYQLQAIEAVCDLFRGQETCRTEFTVTMKAGVAEVPDASRGVMLPQRMSGLTDTDLGG
jgi:type III restriction enzyme